MTMRTFGEKPIAFQLEENGEYYYIGSEVIIIYFPFDSWPIVLEIAYFFPFNNLSYTSI